MDNAEILDVDRREEQSYIFYDRPATGLFGARQQHYVMGKISKTWNDNNTMWYSYNELGQITWMAQQLDGLPEIKYTDFKYDFQGNITKVAYQQNKSDEFTHRFTYNDHGQLLRVETNAQNTPPKIQAEYEYYVDGSLKKTIIDEGLQENDYVYTLQGWLKAVNADELKLGSPTNNKLFSMCLEYFDGDYLAANGLNLSANTNNTQQSHSGQIMAQRWKSIAGGNTGHFASRYNYNHRNELISADFGTMVPLDFGGSTIAGWDFFLSPDYKVNNLTYDDNGNILSLDRDAYGNDREMDRLDYNYKPGTNQLNYIDDLSAGNTDFKDLKKHLDTDNYIYDALGQLIEDKSENLKIKYTSSGLVDEVYELNTNRIKSKYFYGPDGKRVHKKQYIYPSGLGIPDIKDTWYLRNGASITSIYEKLETPTEVTSIAQTELPIYGSGRIGVAYRSSSLDYHYELSDHLGNVRVTFKKNASSGSAEVLSYADYYPFGWQMPGRNSNMNGYRFGYQGQFAEVDEETGWNSFELRSYDGRVGRWMTIDPYRQYHSPYLSMGNNPVSQIDPDGGFAFEPPVNGLAFFKDDTGMYYWNEENQNYDHYYFDSKGDHHISTYVANEFKKPVGNYIVEFNLDDSFKRDYFDGNNTIPIASFLKDELTARGPIEYIYVDDPKYPGVNIIYSKNMIGAITLGNTIFTNTKYYKILAHEYGHYLDFKYHFKFNQSAYLKKIGLPSFSSATKSFFDSSHYHRNTTSEQRADILGGAFFKISLP